MTDQPMTLRERIAELENDLAEGRYGSTMHDAGSAREFVCENLKRHLDETANADAEQARLARIGELVEGLYNTLTIDDHLTIAHEGMGGVWITHSKGRGTESQADSLLDALKSLKAKTEGKC